MSDFLIFQDSPRAKTKAMRMTAKDGGNAENAGAIFCEDWILRFVMAGKIISQKFKFVAEL